MVSKFHPSRKLETNSKTVYYNLPTTWGKKSAAKAAAAKAGVTLQDFVNEAIVEKIEREEK